MLKEKVFRTLIIMWKTNLSEWKDLWKAKFCIAAADVCHHLTSLHYLSESVVQKLLELQKASCHDHFSGELVPVLSHPFSEEPLLNMQYLKFHWCICIPFHQVLSLVWWIEKRLVLASPLIDAVFSQSSLHWTNQVMSATPHTSSPLDHSPS